ncbi:hypothetical protein N7510_011860 [Penicillium lagena]|uniref:uncharacterized protein n=1 Tax=Penicillium lagena TaxID=94218 RepID=UPI0025409007|nr:uncharacterized protein N7510_011860 [Penicillium lagena]KAJ5598910.1 hypothetical protein N7510_011860 [Penicillium lagena]
MSEQPGASVPTAAHGPAMNLRQPATTERKQENTHFNRESNSLARSLACEESTVSQVLLPQYTKLANPGPLGVLSFAITTLTLGLYECGAGKSRAKSSYLRFCSFYGQYGSIYRWSNGFSNWKHLWYHRTLLLWRILAQLCDVPASLPWHRGSIPE